MFTSGIPNAAQPLLTSYLAKF